MSTNKKDPKEWRHAIDLLKKLRLRGTIIESDDMYGMKKLELRGTIIESDAMYGMKTHRDLRRLNRHGSTENDPFWWNSIENDLKELRKVTDLVDTSDEQLLKAVLALRVMLTPKSKDRIASYIRLKEIIDLPSPHGMASYEKRVLSFLEDETCSLLGIWGVRGVGKTTLLRFVRDYAHDFLPYNVFFVGAGEKCTVQTLQHALCFSGLDPPPPHLSLARHISGYLGGTPFLLLVDDVCEGIDLAELGVPMPWMRRNQKVIFTTRNKAICTKMYTKATSFIHMECLGSFIHMECLGEVDAWNLFKDKVGDEIINDPDIRDLANKMVAKCHGLPSFLCTLGRAMSTKRDIKEWRYADDVLSKKLPPHVDKIQEMDDAIYSHLYDLEDALLKHFF